MTQPEQQHHVKQEVAGQQRTLFSGTLRAAEEFIKNNFPRPHVRQGQDTVTADVQLHSPDGSVKEFHGTDAVGADENGFVSIKEGEGNTPIHDELVAEQEGAQQ